MGAVRQAVLEFDEEVQAPWRPRRVPVPGLDAAPAPAVRRRPSHHSPSRVGACRPPAPVPVPARPEAAAGERVARPAGGRAGSRPRPGVRLTRRARRLALVLALCGGVVLGSWVAPFLSGGDEALHLAGASSVVVEPGDTLWSIAASVAGEEDIRAVVDRIQELNGLEGSVVVPGQVLQLP